MNLLYTPRIRGTRKRKRRKAPHWAVIAVLAAVLLIALNWLFQVIRKPSESIGLADAHFYKTPVETWQAYGDLFKENATPLITAEFLAALAQTESSGNPIARTYWRWRWTIRPWNIYAPASSSVGLFQMTDDTFDVARRLCIHSGKVARAGKWGDPMSCWFNSFYNRLVPGHAIEMTSAYLHVTSAEISKIAAKPLSNAQLRRVAAAVHLCGAQRGRLFVQRNLRTGKGEVCGSTDMARYLKRVHFFEARFGEISKEML